MSRSGSTGLPLEGLRVLETVDKAEMCGRYLADLGATVLKAEPSAGAATRHDGPFHRGCSISFAVRNANKLGVALDLERAEDLDDFWRLLGTVDLWIESWRPGALDEAGISISRVRERYPRLVILSITDFGQTGPYRCGTATSWVHTAMCGFLSRSGIGDERPLMPPAALPAEAAAIQASWAAVVGLWNALETGAGDHIDFSILEAAGQIVDPPMGMAGTASSGGSIGGAPMPPARNRPVLEMYPTFACADGFVRMALLSPRQWRAMRAWLGEPDVLMGEELDGIHARFAAADLIRHHIEALVKDQLMMSLVDEAQARGVPCAPVLGLGDVIKADHYVQRQAIGPHEIAPGVRAAVPTGFVEIDGVRVGIRTRAPEVGEHTGEVLASVQEPPAAPARAAWMATPLHPLAGLRVLDLGVIVYGAEVGRMFADMGADVIKVENRTYPDGARVARGGGLYPSFVAGHRGKRSIGLDLRSHEGRALFLQLVERSDVMLSNFKPGTLESLGLGYGALSRANPAIVMVTSSAMGSHGPWSAWMGYGPLVRCATGLTSLWRYPEDPRSFADLTTIYPDHYAARVMATAGLAALIARRRSGRGAHVEGAQAEAILMQLSEMVVLESMEPGAAVPQGNTSDNGSPWGVYRCADDDEWCVITVRTDDEWQRFCGATELTDLGSDPALATAAGRFKHREQVDASVERWVEQHTPRQVQELLQAAGVPAGAMLRVDECGDDPHLIARGYLTQLVQPGLGAITVENAPFLAERIARPRQDPAPEFGEHTREVIAEVLGLSADEIDRLIDAGVLDEHAPARPADACLDVSPQR